MGASLLLGRAPTWTVPRSVTTPAPAPPCVPRPADVRRGRGRRSAGRCSAAEDHAEAPLLVRAARGEAVERPPCWIMRQAGRYMKAYKDLAARYPSFRERSERAELAVEISLQPWHAFKPDGVILFSDILTPLPALGVPFDVHDKVGPILATPIRQHDQVVSMPSLDLSALEFVSTALRALRAEVPASTAVLGFVGSPWTVGTYCVEGGSSTTYKTIKSMALSEPATLHALLQNLARAMAAYACFQAASGADYLMIFDSWGGHLSPRAWDKWSAPYLRHVIQAVKKSHPRVPVCLFVNGGAGLLERMKGCGADVVGLDSFVDMADARRRLGAAQPVQGNVDPVTLFGPRAALEAEIRRCVADAGGRHILNLGHGVMVGTPERAVADMFDIARTMTHAS